MEVDLQKDIEFLVTRQTCAGSVSFAPGRCVGMSSNQLVRFAYTGLHSGILPSDWADLMACARTMRMMPRHRRTPDVWEWYQKGRAHVLSKYPRENR